MSADTPAEVEEEFDRLLALKSGSERVRMASDMFDAAKALVTADILATNPTLSAAELRAALFERLYGDDFSDDARAEIRARLLGKGEAR